MAAPEEAEFAAVLLRARVGRQLSRQRAEIGAAPKPGDDLFGLLACRHQNVTGTICGPVGRRRRRSRRSSVFQRFSVRPRCRPTSAFNRDFSTTLGGFLVSTTVFVGNARLLRRLSLLALAASADRRRSADCWACSTAGAGWAVERRLVRRGGGARRKRQHPATLSLACGTFVHFARCPGSGPERGSMLVHIANAHLATRRRPLAPPAPVPDRR